MTIPIHQDQEEMVEHRDKINTDTANVSQVEMREFVDKVHVPQVHSLGYEGVGFSFTHVLADGVLDEDQMRRLKEGFLACWVHWRTRRSLTLSAPVQ